MPRQKKPWFRLYVDIVRDAKIRRLLPEYRWLFVVILAMARESPVPGVLMVSERMPATLTDMVDASGLKLREVVKATDIMSDLDLIAFDPESEAWFVVAWDARQYESDHRPNHHVGTT